MQTIAPVQHGINAAHGIFQCVNWKILHPNATFVPTQNAQGHAWLSDSKNKRAIDLTPKKVTCNYGKPNFQP